MIDIHNPFLQSRKFIDSKIHLSVTGSVACYKAIELMRTWRHLQIGVTATISEGARQFVTPLLFRSLGADYVYGEMFADENIFAHLEPGQKAGAMVIAPASANALAKLANGLANDMFSAQALAFTGPVIIAPAMNPRMWANAATQANVKKLLDRGYILAEPGHGEAACGEKGQGRLADLAEIFFLSLKALCKQDLNGLKVIATLGPTREAWDGVRFFSNPSSGRMGAALATAAWLRGAEVTAICGPGISITLPAQIKRINVSNAREMFAAASGIWPEMNWGIFCAAVADFAPVRPPNAANLKIKKTDAGTELNIKLERNPDILASLAARRSNSQKIMGFAAEITPDMRSLLPLAAAKLHTKHADMIVANRVNAENGAFGSDNNIVAVVTKDGAEEILDSQSKADLAWDLCSWLSRI